MIINPKVVELFKRGYSPSQIDKKLALVPGIARATVRAWWRADRDQHTDHEIDSYDNYADYKIDASEPTAATSFHMVKESL